MDLFEHTAVKNQENRAPLADRMRPSTLNEYLGQEKLTGKNALLRTVIEEDNIPSMILWGPPGSGKTTLANIIAKNTNAYYTTISAVNSSVKQIREVMEIAKNKWIYGKKKTILFVDEIHRFNKRQLDSFLPYVEDGTIILIGATTENPSFEINAALLSRCRVFTLSRLSDESILNILKLALTDSERGYGDTPIKVSGKTLLCLARMANGDARNALNALELAIQITPKKDAGKLSLKFIKEALQKSHLMYDKDGEEHYNLKSALHKSMRGSDVNASLYWLGRMLEAGEVPTYIARRLVRFAAEDIGLADPQALVQAMTAMDAAHKVGMPECNLILAQAVAYLALAPKSNALYIAYKSVQDDIHNLPTYPVPLHLRNAPTELMKDLGYGKGYKYTPNFKNKEDAKQQYLPDELKNRIYLKYEDQ